MCSAPEACRVKVQCLKTHWTWRTMNTPEDTPLLPAAWKSTAGRPWRGVPTETGGEEPTVLVAGSPSRPMSSVQSRASRTKNGRLRYAVDQLDGAAGPRRGDDEAGV